MIRKPAYFILGYAVILFLIFRFVTDQELPLYRILIKVAISSLLTFLFMHGLKLLKRSGN